MRRFERADGRPVNGVVPPQGRQRHRGAATKAEPQQTEPVEDTAPTETGRARITSDGLAVAPADAPEEVKQVIAAGNEIAKKPYKYGGGHGDWTDSGYDCSGSVSYALHGAGLLQPPEDSGEFMSWGFSGRGEWITVYANGGHVYMKVAGHPLRHERARRGRHPLARHDAGQPRAATQSGIHAGFEHITAWKLGVFAKRAATLPASFVSHLPNLRPPPAGERGNQWPSVRRPGANRDTAVA